MSQVLNKYNIEALLSFVLILSLIGIPTTLTTPAFANTLKSVPTNGTKRQDAGDAYGALALSFELNQGQTNQRVKFLARSEGYVLFLTATEAVMALDNPAAHQKGKENRDALHRAGDSAARPPRRIVRMKLEGANPEPRIEGLEQLPATSNYFTGSNPADWHTGIPSFNRVRYTQVYPGIDMVYYGNQRRLENDFVVAPGARPDVIQVAFSGIKDFEIDRMGDLVLRTEQGNIRQSKPVAYQEANGVKEDVPVSYVPTGVDHVGFHVGAYDPTRPLIIDPVLTYSTYLGGSGFDQGYAIAIDSLGNAYVTGATAAIDFPTTPGAFQPSSRGGDAFVTKINPSGTALVYATYLNGASGNGIAVDSNGNAYITGEAETTNFPTTPSAFQTAPMGFDTFVTKLNPAGSARGYSAARRGSVVRLS